MWVGDPRRSLCFQVKADLRTIRSITFATGYSLRFPRIQFVRWPRALAACLSAWQRVAVWGSVPCMPAPMPAMSTAFLATSHLLF